MDLISTDYLLNKKVIMLQKKGAYHTSSDAVLLSSMIDQVKDGALILDVGSGTGGVSLCLAYRFKNALIKGFEIQQELLDCANESARLNGFKNLEYILHNIKAKKAPIPFCSSDIVITNPPYNSEKTLPSSNKSKQTAHIGDDVDLRAWLAFCVKMLKPKGLLYLINRVDNMPEILDVLSSKKMGNISVVPVYSIDGKPANRVMIRAQKDSKAPLKILPPLVIRCNGVFTMQAEQILREGKSLFQIDNCKT